MDQRLQYRPTLTTRLLWHPLLRLIAGLNLGVIRGLSLAHRGLMALRRLFWRVPLLGQALDALLTPIYIAGFILYVGAFGGLILVTLISLRLGLRSVRPVFVKPSRGRPIDVDFRDA